MAPFGDCPARLAHAAGFDGRAACRPGRSQFSALATSRAVEVLPTPRTGQQECMGDTAALDRIRLVSSPLHLADQFGESLRAIFASENAIMHVVEGLRLFGQVGPRPGDLSSSTPVRFSLVTRR
jgi:hypothetical protein